MEKGLPVYFSHYCLWRQPPFWTNETTKHNLQSPLRSGPSDFTPSLMALLQPVRLAELVGPAGDPAATDEMDKTPSPSARVCVRGRRSTGQLRPPAPLGWHKQPNLGTISSAPTSFSAKGSEVRPRSLLWHCKRMSPLPAHPHLRQRRGRLGEANSSPG